MYFSTLESAGDLVLLVLVALPPGLLLLRLGEWFVGHRLALSEVERGISAIYATGLVLFVLASLPLAVYGLLLFAGVLILGWAGYAVVALREHALGLRSAGQFATRPVAWVLLAGTVGLLLLQLTAVSGLQYPNTYDGATAALWTKLTLANHTLPWTLQPFATFGVSYPQGPTVWLSMFSLLFGGPFASLPLLLPPLFVALTIPAAFCWGERLRPPNLVNVPWTGLVFAGFFGLVANYTRPWEGGSYDFTIALPLLLVALGWLWPLSENASLSWPEVVLLGALIGTLLSLNAVTGQLLVLLLVGGTALRAGATRALGRRLIRILSATLIGLAFILRSVLALLVWYSYPGHILTETGNPPYVQPPLSYSFGSQLFMGELDPFLASKPKLSPILYMSIQIEILLGVGIVALALYYLVSENSWRSLFPPKMVESAVLGTVVTFAFTAFLILPTIPGSPLREIGFVSSLEEASVLLFLFYELIAMVPIIAAVALLTERAAPLRVREDARRSTSSRARSPDHAPRPVDPADRRAWKIALAVALAVPLVSGAYGSVMQEPSLLRNGTLAMANVTQADVDAMNWAGSHLPSCSRVLVAPGSAAQFLPQFLTASLVYPMNPSPVNLSYSQVVSDLRNGTYQNQTRMGLIWLGITELFGTGPTSSSYLPFDVGPLVGSPDFRVLFQEGDATILEFEPVVTASGCGG